MVFVALRLPSIVEPPTLADEGTYADIGWALDHGAVLYRDVWGHYTPGAYWLGAAINLVSSTVLAFHLVLAAVVTLTAFAVWRFCRRFASPTVAWMATMAFIVIASLPTFEGDVLYVETVGALLATWAVVIVTRRARLGMTGALAAGALAAGAVLFKVTFVADGVVIASLPAVVAIASGRRPGRTELRAAAAVVTGGLALLAVAATGLWLGGSMPGLLDVLTNQDERYLQFTTNGGAAVVAGGSGRFLLVLAVVRVAVVLLVGALLAWRLARRRHLAAAVGVWWLTWDLAAVVLSGSGLAHYAQQMAPALCVCAALLVQQLWRRLRAGALLGAAATTLVAWTVCVAALVTPTAEASAVVRQHIGDFASAIVSPRQVIHVVGRGWERVAGVITPDAYSLSFGSQPALVARTVAVIDAHSVRGDRVFVWGRLPWAYTLSGRMPAGRYTSLNSSYALDPGAMPLLVRQLRAHPPAVLVQLEPLPPAVTSLLHALGYRPLAAGGAVAWVAPGGR